MLYRFERKYILNPQTAGILKKRAAALLKPDSNSGGSYWVNNVYFDDMYNSAYQAKINGSYDKDKYRIRYYNDDLSYIRLEHKQKKGELSAKRSVAITVEQYEKMIRGGLPEEFSAGEPVLESFYRLYRVYGLRPVVAFKYFREAYTHPAGSVRITFDSRIAEGTPGVHGVMELKYSRFLPCFISELLTGLSLVHTETSKYSMVAEGHRKVNPYGKFT